MTLPEGIAQERFLFLQEAVAAASALASADRLGVLERIDAGPVSPDAVAHECGIGQRGSRLLMSALAGLGIVQTGEDGLYRSAVPNLSQHTKLLALWPQLDEVLRHDRPVIDAGSAEGAGKLYPDIVASLGSLLSPVAERVADYLYTPGLRVLDIGAGAAP